MSDGQRDRSALFAHQSVACRYRQGERIIADECIYVSQTEIKRWRKSGNSSVDILDYPARKRKILRNFHFILPKFRFILPNFYFAPPWRIFVFS